MLARKRCKDTGRKRLLGKGKTLTLTRWEYIHLDMRLKKLFYFDLLKGNDEPYFEWKGGKLIS